MLVCWSECVQSAAGEKLDGKVGRRAIGQVLALVFVIFP